MKDWICTVCQHEVLSKAMPEPIERIDGHTCYFVLKNDEIAAFQVLNRFGNPASNDFGDLCIFPKKDLAEGFIEYLNECGCGNEENVFTIRPVMVLLNKGDQ